MKLPVTTDGLFDEATLDSWFRDLTLCADVAEVRIKGAKRQRADDAPLTLEAAGERLKNGACRALQVRYHYEEDEWCDTVLREDGGHYKIVRIRTRDILSTLESPSTPPTSP